MKANNNPVFSVTVPAYKAKFLAECIDSILAQTYKNFELVIVNDASPQDLDSIVRKYDDPRIKYYKNEAGFGAAHVVGNWNKCLKYATGDYVICMGDDDKLLPGCLEEYAKLITSHPGLGIYHSQTLLIDESSKVIGAQEPRPLYESTYSMLYFRWKGQRIQYIGDWLFDTRNLKAKGGFVETPYAWEADDLSVAIAAKERGIANMQVPGFLYRINRLTISNNTYNVPDKLRAHLQAIDEYKVLLQDEPEDNIDKLYRSLLLESLPKHLYNGQVMDLTADLRGNPSHVFHWVKNRKEFKITNKAILKALTNALKKRLNR